MKLIKLLLLAYMAIVFVGCGDSSNKKTSPKERSVEYKMENPVIKGDARDYLKVQQYFPSEIPPDIFEKIKASAKDSFPDNYGTQLFSMKGDVRDYLKVQQYSPSEITQSQE